MGNRRENRRQRKQPSSRGVPKEDPVIVLLGSQAVGIRQLPAAGITGLPRLQASLYKMDLKKKKIYLFIFREREREGEREGEKHRSVTSHTPPTRDLACNPGMCPGRELNWQPFDLQASTQTTEPHQPGLSIAILNKNFILE